MLTTGCLWLLSNTILSALLLVAVFEFSEGSKHGTRTLVAGVLSRMIILILISLASCLQRFTLLTNVRHPVAHGH